MVKGYPVKKDGVAFQSHLIKDFSKNPHPFSKFGRGSFCITQLDKFL